MPAGACAWIRHWNAASPIRSRTIRHQPKGRAQSQNRRHWSTVRELRTSGSVKTMPSTLAISARKPATKSTT
ncbi:hypothetical protein CGZ94_01505 [Enemella evansiae]|uniref:Uncharacterized protein n=1 Tax=Enemella evansiae TaxID=2016499 RepID=A0A255GSH5_9ACTN|nr:hypothetical protein CGZ94_01505 [Enemella evansiae]